MFSTIVLCGVVTLLCLFAVSLAAYVHRLFKANRSRRLDLCSAFLAIGFLPMAIMTISNIGLGSPTFVNFNNPILLNFITYLRNPFLGIDVTIGAFAQIGELSFLMDFLTAIFLSSTVVITLSHHAIIGGSEERLSSSRKATCKSKPAVKPIEERVVARPYLCYGCFLS